MTDDIIRIRANAALEAIEEAAVLLHERKCKKARRLLELAQRDLVTLMRDLRQR